MRTTYKGIVTKYVVYQATDKIVSILTPDGNLVSFKAKGAVRLSSPFALATNLGSIGEYEVEEKGKWSTLEECECVFNASNVSKSIESYATLCFVLEALGYVEVVASTYSLVEKIVKILNKNEKQLLTAVFYLYQLIKLDGIELQLDNCVICGNKNGIVDIDYLEGGFLCKEHAARVVDEKYLKAIRVISKADYSNFDSLDIDEKTLENLLKDLLVYFEDNVGYHLQSLKFLRDSLVK